jgi:hypothetical protein
MVRRNYIETKKIALATWVDKTVNLTLIKNKIISRFKGTRIWPFNPRAMDSKIGLRILYTFQNQAKEKEESE